MFVITAGGLTQLRYYMNDGKRPRYNLDPWDRAGIIAPLDVPTLIYCSKVNSASAILSYDAYYSPVMDRDMRLTGKRRGQTDNVQAPKGFELSSAWKVCSLSLHSCYNLTSV